MSKKFKNRAGFKAVVRPNVASGSATRHMRIVPAESNGPVAGPVTRPAPPARLASEEFYFADDAEGRDQERRLNTAVTNGKAALWRAELQLADYFSACVQTLFAEEAGLERRQPSRADAPSALFVSLKQRYALQAFDLREKNGYLSPGSYSELPYERVKAARNPWATTAELSLLGHDESGDVRCAAAAQLESRAE